MQLLTPPRKIVLLIPANPSCNKNTLQTLIDLAVVAAAEAAAALGSGAVPLVGHCREPRVAV